jgi:thiopurine S-methyltransferase
MSLKFWHEVWLGGSPSFHLPRPHSQLVKFFSQLKRAEKSWKPRGKPPAKAPAQVPAKILVPLCGKSGDLLWLRLKGYEVVGIETSPVACRAFFEENKIRYKKKTVAKTPVYTGGGITLWCGDYFKIPAQAWEGCAWIYDRAALIALPPLTRKKYVRYLERRFLDGVGVFLITNEYRRDDRLGPPFSVSRAEVTALYRRAFKIRRLETRLDKRLTGSAPKFTKVRVRETAYLLLRK